MFTDENRFILSIAIFR